MIAYFYGKVASVGRGKFILATESGIGYEIRYGQGLDPKPGELLECYVVQSFPQSGPQVLFGYANAVDREIAQVLEDTDGVGPTAAHRIVHALGSQLLIEIAANRATLGSRKVATVGKAKIEKAIATLAKTMTSTGIASAQSPVCIKIVEALEAMGLDASVFTNAISTVLADPSSAELSTSAIVSAVLKKGNQ